MRACAFVSSRSSPGPSARRKSGGSKRRRLLPLRVEPVERRISQAECAYPHGNLGDCQELRPVLLWRPALPPGFRRRISGRLATVGNLGAAASTDRIALPGKEGRTLHIEREQSFSD